MSFVDWFAFLSCVPPITVHDECNVVGKRARSDDPEQKASQEAKDDIKQPPHSATQYKHSKVDRLRNRDVLI